MLAGERSTDVLSFHECLVRPRVEYQHGLEVGAEFAIVEGSLRHLHRVVDGDRAQRDVYDH